MGYGLTPLFSAQACGGLALMPPGASAQSVGQGCRAGPPPANNGPGAPESGLSVEGRLLVKALPCWDFPGLSVAKNLPAIQESQVGPLGQKDPLEEGTATRSVLLPGEPHGWRSLAGCSPWGHRVGCDWSDSAHAAGSWSRLPLRQARGLAQAVPGL